jgi:hypothetical protein
MEQLIQFNKNLITSKLDYSRPCYPVQNKYIYYKNIREWLVPFVSVFEENNKDALVNYIKETINSHDILRSTFSQSDEGTVQINIHKYNDCINIPLYEIKTEKELGDYILLLTNNLKERETFGDILYNIALIKHESKIHLVCIFNHMLYDGSFDFENNFLNACSSEITLDKINQYMESIDDSNYKGFELYVNSKRQILNSYKRDENSSLTINFSTLFFLRNKGYTVEEFWVVSVYLTLLKLFPTSKAIPLCILTNGRTIGELLFAKDFGDFHDEIMLTHQADHSVLECISEYRKYKEQPYRNAKEYIKYIINNNVGEEIVGYMEPIILLIAGESTKAEEQIHYKQYIPRDKKHFLSIKITCSPSLTRFTISLRYTKEIEDQIKLFEKAMNEVVINLTEEVLK